MLKFLHIFYIVDGHFTIIFGEISIQVLRLFYFILFYLGPHLRHMEVPRLGVELELYSQPIPQPQQDGIQATSATYTTAHGNARSLTY